jgi:flagellar biosynthesis regulator FlaF
MGSTWAVDLKDIGAVYPWLGWELMMVLIGIALWILWHIVQINQENREFAEDIKKYGNKESIKKALDDHPI